MEENNRSWEKTRKKLFAMVSTGVVDSRLNQAYDIISTLALIANLVAAFAVTFDNVRAQYGTLLYWIDEVTVAFFAVDYVLTHCPPTGQYDRYRARWSGFWGPSDEWTDWLEEHVEGAFSYKRWYYGHLHFDSDVDDPHIAVFDEIVKL